MTDDGTGLGTILGVWAHPDDEAYLSAGVMAMAVRDGRRVVCVTATRGELGFPDDDPRTLDERAALRTAELDACLAELGVAEHVWLDYPDGGCDAIDEALPAAQVARIIDDVRPDTVLTFGPEGMTGHRDHISVGRWATRAVGMSEHKPRLLYSTRTAEWNEKIGAVIDISVVMMDDIEQPETPERDLAVWARLDEDQLLQKVRALCHQASQVGPFAEMAGDEGYRSLNSEEFFRSPTDRDFVSRADM